MSYLLTGILRLQKYNLKYQEFILSKYKCTYIYKKKKLNIFKK